MKFAKRKTFQNRVGSQIMSSSAKLAFRAGRVSLLRLTTLQVQVESMAVQEHGKKEEHEHCDLKGTEVGFKKRANQLGDH